MYKKIFFVLFVIEIGAYYLGFSLFYVGVSFCSTVVAYMVVHGWVLSRRAKRNQPPYYIYPYAQPLSTWEVDPTSETASRLRLLYGVLTFLLTLGLAPVVIRGVQSGDLFWWLCTGMLILAIVFINLVPFGRTGLGFTESGDIVLHQHFLLYRQKQRIVPQGEIKGVLLRVFKLTDSKQPSSCNQVILQLGQSEIGVAQEFLPLAAIDELAKSVALSEWARNLAAHLGVTFSMQDLGDQSKAVGASVRLS